MTKRKTWRRVAVKPLIACILVVIVCFILYALVAVLQDPAKGLKSSEAAGWMQAIGAIVGIGIAIWVPYQQRHDAVESENQRRADEERAILRSIADELAVVQSDISNDAKVQKLLGLPPSEPMEAIVPVSKTPFPIYSAIVGRIDKIRDDEVRREIITFYAYANGFLRAVEMNNVLIQGYREAKHLAGQNGSVANTNEIYFRLNAAVEHAQDLKILLVDNQKRLTAVIITLARSIRNDQ